MVFDEEKKTLIFEHEGGEQGQRWIIRLATFFTILNSFLAISEYAYPIFGGWNGVSFSLCTLTGIGILSGMAIFSKRTIHKMHLYRNGNLVKILFFNSFWIPQTKVIHITEFANLTPSFQGFHRTELTTMGKTWINLEKNIFTHDQVYQKILENILNGQVIKLDQGVIGSQKYYKKYVQK